MARCLATARAVVSLSPVSMTSTQAILLQGLQRARRCFLDGVADGDGAGKLAVDAEEHDRLSFASQFRELSGESVYRCAHAAHQRFVS